MLCNVDGICCLSYDEFCYVLSVESDEPNKQIKVQRKERTKYTVTGNDNELGHKIGNTDFPRKIYEQKATQL